MISLPSSDLRTLSITTKIITAYVSYNHVQPSDLLVAISGVYRMIVDITSVKEPPEEHLKATTRQIEQSVTPDFLISFEDGKPYKTLRRHLALHGLTPEAYREKWGLASDYPMTAPAYSQKRAALARASGLGLRHRTPAAQAAAGSNKRPRSRPSVTA